MITRTYNMRILLAIFLQASNIVISHLVASKQQHEVLTIYNSITQAIATIATLIHYLDTL